MVRIQVKITAHDGTTKKPDLVSCICDVDAYANRIITSRDAFFSITDNVNMETLLREESRAKFAARGLEIQFPPEYSSERTVLLRNVDPVITEMSEVEIKEKIDNKYKINKIIKIPNNNRLLKIIFRDSKTADTVVGEGIRVYFQKLDKKNLEKEMFIPLIPCYRCYSYEHQKRPKWWGIWPLLLLLLLIVWLMFLLCW